MKFTAILQKRLSVAALAVAGVSLIATLTVIASEPSESGWSVARPQSVLDHPPSNSPEVRIAINQLLEQSRMPLIPTPSPAAQQAQTTKETPATESTTQPFAPPAIELPTEATTEQQPAAAESPKVNAVEVSESPDDGPRIVFGNASTSADGWRPARLHSEPPHSTAGETDDTSASRSVTSDITPIRPRFRPVSSKATSATPADTIPESSESPADQAAESAEPPSSKPSVSAKTFTTNEQSGNESDEAEADSENKPVANRALVDGPPDELPPLTRNQKNLRAKIRRVIKSYYTRPLNSRDNDPWELMHGMLAYGVHSKIRQGGPRGDTITLVGWLCYNKPSKGFTLLYLTPENELRAKQGVGLQGHMGQFLAMLAQCQVSPDYPIRVRGQEFAIHDLIEAEKATCYPRSELTFKLIALMHYLDSDASWVNDQGQSWDIPRLIREELAQPIRGAACGGTHRLSGLSLAARTRVRRGEPLDGEYLRAAQFVEKYQNYAFQLQNRDGSLSTEWFRGRGDEDDIDRRVKTTGHILEWLCYSVSDKEVRGSRMFAATNYLSTLLATNFNHEWEVGPLGHAIHALRLYDERVFQPYDKLENVAKKPVQKTARRQAPAAQPRSHTMGF